MCNRFSDPVCAAHEPALRAELDAAQAALTAAMRDLADTDRQLSTTAAERTAELGSLNRLQEQHLAQLRAHRPDLVKTARDAEATVTQLQARHDQTTRGLADLRATLTKGNLTGAGRAHIEARLALAERRRAAAENRWKTSASWAEDRLRAAKGTRRFNRYLDLVAERRAAEHSAQWPPPSGPARSAWEDTAAGRTYAALSARSAPYPQVTFAIPEVIDARYRRPNVPGYDPLLAAHHAHLPPVLRPESGAATAALHRAAHTGKPWQVSHAELIAAVRAEPDTFVDDQAAVPVHDAVAGQQWKTLRVVGPLTIGPGGGAGPRDRTIYTGWVLVRINDSRMVVTDTHPGYTHEAHHERARR